MKANSDKSNLPMSSKYIAGVNKIECVSYRRCSVKKAFLEISQILQESTCV